MRIRTPALAALLFISFAVGLVTGAYLPNLTMVDRWSGQIPSLSIPNAPDADQKKQARDLLEELSTRSETLLKQLMLLRNDLRETRVACQVLRSQGFQDDAPTVREQEERLQRLKLQEATLQDQLKEVQRLQEELQAAQRKETAQTTEILPFELKTRVQAYLLRQPGFPHLSLTPQSK